MARDMKPKSDTRTLAELLRDLADLQRVLYGSRLRLRRQGLGRHAEGTVYAVRATKVRAHVRRAYVAVRLTR